MKTTTTKETRSPAMMTPPPLPQAKTRKPSGAALIGWIWLALLASAIGKLGPGPFMEAAAEFWSDLVILLSWIE
jgi:hypothetical protein